METGDLRIECPKCSASLVLISTAYGYRAICTDCKIRWTKLWSEEANEFTAEFYSPMADNLHTKEGPQDG